MMFSTKRRTLSSLLSDYFICIYEMYTLMVASVYAEPLPLKELFMYMYTQIEVVIFIVSSGC